MALHRILLVLFFFSRLPLEAAAPIVTSVSPSHGAPGDIIRIAGRNFATAGTPGVYFGGGLQPATLSTVSGLEIQARVPTNATIGPIMVTNHDGAFTTTQDFIAAPYVESFEKQFPTPTGENDIHRGKAGDTVFVEGLNFESINKSPIGIAYFFGAVRATFDSRGTRSVLLDVPAGAVTGPLIITNVGGSYSTGSDYFYIAPTLSSFTAKAAVGDSLSVTGKSLLGVDSVVIDAVNVPQFTIQGVTGTNILAIVPTNAPLSGKITVSSLGGSATTTTSFLLLPSVTGVNVSGRPAVGAEPGTIVNLRGFGLTGASSVTFGGVAIKPTSASATGIAVKVPTGALSGFIGVVTPNGTGTSKSNFFIAPRITGFSTNQALPGARITVFGANFVGTTQVIINDTAATNFTVIDSGTLAVTVPSRPGITTIGVYNPGGSAFSEAKFTVFGTKPVVTSFTPKFGPPNTTVTITGQNFASAQAVRFNGQAAKSFKILTDTQLTAIVSDTATSGPITVVGPSGSVPSTNDFLVGNTADVGVKLSANPTSPITGSGLTVSFTVTNNGPLDALGVRTSFPVPPAVEFLKATSTRGTPTFDGTTVFILIGDLSVGRTVTGEVSLRVNSSTNLTLAMNLFSNTTDTNTANNSAHLSFTSGAISLQVGRLSDKIHLAWPNDTNYVLERSPALSPQSWVKVPTAPSSDGTGLFLDLPTTNSPSFFRLHGP